MMPSLTTQLYWGREEGLMLTQVQRFDYSMELDIKITELGLHL